jgi:hypothetical protein
MEKQVADMVDQFSQMKDTSIVFIVMVLTIFISIISILFYWYYKTLRSRNCKSMDYIYGDLNGKIHSIDDGENFQYTFKDYYIKSAYNCCSGGNYKNDYVDTCVLKDLLKQGVRGLDFEIFSINDQPVIATSTSDSYHVKETFNSVPFSSAMNVIRDNAFATATAPNSADPIILHFRFKSSNQIMYQNLAKILESYDSILLSKEYDSEYYGENFGNVELRKLMGKVVIIVERSNTSFMECPEFYKFVNMTSNSMFMRALHYYDIQYTPDMNELIEYNKQNMTIGMPDKGSDPANPNSVVMREMGIQMLAMRYQEIDTNVEENDALFNENGYAFVLKPEKLRYVPETIEKPAAQRPELSYDTRTIQSDYYKFNI